MKRPIFLTYTPVFYILHLTQEGVTKVQTFQDSSITGVIPGADKAAGMQGKSNLATLKRQGYLNKVNKNPFEYAMRISSISNPNYTAFTVDYKPYDANEIGAHFKAGADNMVIQLNPDYPEHHYTAA